MAGLVREYISPVVTSWVSSLTVNCVMLECCGPEFSVSASGFSSAAWTANLAIYVPLIVFERTTVSQFFWINGGTTGGNTDVGIYNSDGTTKLGSTGSTANSGTNARQTVNVSDFTIDPLQRYWLALASDSGTQTYHRNAAATVLLDYVGVKQQTSAWSSGLPTSTTFATPSVAIIPLFGFTAGAF